MLNELNISKIDTTNAIYTDHISIGCANKISIYCEIQMYMDIISIIFKITSIIILFILFELF